MGQSTTRAVMISVPRSPSVLGKALMSQPLGPRISFVERTKCQLQIKEPNSVVLMLLVLVTRMHAVMTLAARSLSRLARALMLPVPRLSTAVRTRYQLPSNPLSHQAVIPSVPERRERVTQPLAAQ